VATDGSVLADASCATSGDKPSEITTMADYSGCSYAWQPNGFGDWSSSCSTKAMRDVKTICQRQDGVTAEDASCDAATRPAYTEEAQILAGCTYEAAYSTTYSTCAAERQSAPIISCTRSDGTKVDLDKCAEQSVVRACEMPATWSYGLWGTWSSMCSDSAKRTRSATCMVDGKVAPDYRCTAAKEPVEETGCASIVPNGTFENGNVNGWTGSDGIYGGAAGYGADGSRYVMGVAPGQTARLTVTGMEANKAYTLTLMCKGRSNSPATARISTNTITQNITCGGSTYASVTANFSGNGTTDTITLYRSSATIDYDNISIQPR